MYHANYSNTNQLVNKYRQA